MNEIVGMHEAKFTLSQLVQCATAGETLLIGPHGRADEKLVAVDAPVRAKRRIGILKGKLNLAKDFGPPLPNDVLRTFEGEA